MIKVVYIDCFFLSEQKTTGVGRFARQLLQALDKQIGLQAKYDDYKFIGLMPNFDLEIPKLDNMEIKKCTQVMNRHIWCQVILPLAVRSRFLINLTNFAPVFKRNQLCIIMDALVYAYPDCYSKKFNMISKFISSKIMKNSKYIGTISMFSAREILKYVGPVKNEMIILGCSAENFIDIASDSNILHQHGLSKNGYVLSVFSQKNSSYKNVESYLKSIKSIDFKFVCTGNIDKKYTNNTNIINIGFVTDNELKALYENALCFVFPSVYEGFGIPPLEAMTCGCPVLAADIPVLHEVCGDAAIYLNPYDIDEMCQSISSYINSPSIREKMINKGKEQIKLFNWQKYAKTLLDIIESK